MALFKSAQNYFEADDDIIDLGEDDDVILYDERPSEDEVIELHSDLDEEQEDDHHHSHEHNGDHHSGMGGEAVVFSLPKLPGCDAVEVEPLEVSSLDPIEVLDEGEKETKSKSSDKEDANDSDPWTTLDKKGPKHIVQWAQDMVKTLPRHSGKEILGVERVIACFDKMLRAISKCIQSDIRGEADIEAVEKVRNELLAGKRRLEKHREALEKMQSVAMDEKDGLVKKAQKTGNFVVCVPVLISSIARTAINSTVSAGKDLEKVVAQLIKEYELNKREQAELFQVLADSNFPLFRPRGYSFDTKIDTTSVDNLDWAANYSA
jgi:hypothetical protein